MKNKGRIFKFTNVIKNAGDKKGQKEKNIADSISLRNIEYLFCLREVDDNHLLCCAVYGEKHKNSINIQDKQGNDYWISFAQFDSVNILCLEKTIVFIENSYDLVNRVYDEHSKKKENDLKNRHARFEEKKKKEREKKKSNILMNSTINNFNSKKRSLKRKRRSKMLNGEIHHENTYSSVMDDDYEERYEKRMKWLIDHPYQGGRGK